VKQVNWNSIWHITPLTTRLLHIKVKSETTPKL
jgi:hypothetical protein